MGAVVLFCMERGTVRDEIDTLSFAVPSIERRPVVNMPAIPTSYKFVLPETSSESKVAELVAIESSAEEVAGWRRGEGGVKSVGGRTNTFSSPHSLQELDVAAIETSTYDAEAEALSVVSGRNIRLLSFCESFTLISLQ